jgi:hypothetical protein
MPLDTGTLKSTLKAAMLANVPSPTAEQTNQVDMLCGVMANAMAVFVAGATITYSTGLVAPPTGGPVTGVFTNVIS